MKHFYAWLVILTSFAWLGEATDVGNDKLTRTRNRVRSTNKKKQAGGMSFKIGLGSSDSRNLQDCTPIASCFEVQTTTRDYCNLSADVSQNQKRFVDFLQQEFIPQLERLENYGVGNTNDVTCDSIQKIVKKGLKTLSSALNPCKTIKKKKADLAYLTRLDDTLKSMEKMPVVKKPAKYIRLVLVKPLASVTESLKTLEEKCKTFDSKVRIYLSKVLDKIPVVTKMIKRVRYRLIYELTVQCALKGSLSPLRARSLRIVRLLEDELSKKTGRNHRGRRLGFDPAKIDDEAMLAARPFISAAECVLIPFGEGIELVSSELENLFLPVSNFLSGFDPLVAAYNSPFGDIVDGFASIVDKLSFLQCPREELGIFGFLCDLDSLIVTVIEGILKLIGIDIEKIIGEIVDPIFDALDLPDAGLLGGFFPDLTILGVDFEAELLAPIQASIKEVFERLTVDPLQNAFAVTGESDLDIQGIDLEFRYTTGTIESVEISCADLIGSFPLSVSAFVNKACGTSDITGALEFPCGQESGCVVAGGSLSGRTCSQDFQDDPDFGFSSTMFDKTAIVYTCVTSAQLENITSLPTPQREESADLSKVQCSPGSTVYPYQVVAGDQLVSSNLCDQTFSSISAAARMISDNCDGAQCTGGRICVLRGESRVRVFPDYLCLVDGRDTPSVVSGENVEFFVSGPFPSQSDRPIFKDLLYLDCASENRWSENVDVIEAFRGPGGFKTFEDRTQFFRDRCHPKPTEEFYFNTNYICTFRESDDAADDDLVYRVVYQCVCAKHHHLERDSEGRCVFCGEGRYRDYSDPTCQDCPPGTYLPPSPGLCQEFGSLPGADSCQTCNIGMYSDSPASAECTECPPGTFNSVEGARSVDDCDECPAGTFSSLTVVRQNVGPCPPSNPSGAPDLPIVFTESKCEPCPAGTDSPTGSSECFPTPLGSFNDGSGTLLCAPGSFANTTGAIACTLCPHGSYSRRAGSATSDCIPCPLGAYSDTQGSTVCKACPEQKTTFTLGASTAEQCVELPSPIQYGDAEYNSFTCSELLEIDLKITVANLTLRATLLQRRLNQVGNGLCNNVPWNTEQCQWDGGDCCPLTCVIPGEDDVGDDQFISDLSCTQSTFACRDPNAQGKALGQCVLADDIPLRHRTLDEGVVRIGAMGLEQVGDGVCDPDFNSFFFDFDGGDCCPFTCNLNVLFPNSCLGTSEFCRTESPDIEAPKISFGDFKNPEDAVANCSSIPAAPIAFATDNDPCFDGVVVYSETQVGTGENSYDLVRSWTAADAAGNKRLVVAKVSVEDADQCPTEPCSPWWWILPCWAWDLKQSLFCFSAISTVQVEHRALPVAMKDLKIGDHVLTSKKHAYEPIIAFLHWHTTKPASFLQIFTDSNQTSSPLEISKEHMVFVHGRKGLVRADAIKVGDALVSVNQRAEFAPITVSHIGAINRKGLYAPLTKSGTIVVNGVVASTYASVLRTNDSWYFTILGDPQAISHMYLSPLRVFCTFCASKFCQRYDEEGVHEYAALGMRFVEWCNQQNAVVQASSLALVSSVTAVFSVIEILMVPTYGALLLVVAVLASWTITKNKKQV